LHEFRICVAQPKDFPSDNELSVPLSVNGRRGQLTAAGGGEKIRDYLLPLYRRYGKEPDCRIELYDCAHLELPTILCAT